MEHHIGRERWMTNPATGEKCAVSVIRDAVYFPPIGESDYDGGEWGTYRFGAWLEEDLWDKGCFIISFPYWRNGNFAGQYSLRVEPLVLRRLLRLMESRGWLRQKGWSDRQRKSRPTIRSTPTRRKRRAG